MNEEEKVRKLTPLKKIEDINIDNDRLILYVVKLLEKEGIEPTFDKIVVASFKLFPKRFSLTGFEEYPDAKRVHDCLFHCTYKTKGWLIGNPQSAYKISPKGVYYLDETNKIMDEEVQLPKKYKEKVKRKERTAIDTLKKTIAFNKYLNKKEDEINREDVKDALRVFKYANSEDIKRNFNKYVSYATLLEDRGVIDFLNFINKKGLLK